MLTLLLFVLSTQAPQDPGIIYTPTREGLAPLDAEREAQVRRVGKKLRCAVCQGESIVDSPASMAVAQLDKVRELVAAGKSDDEIYGFFASRYGEWVLLEPSKEGLNLVLWLGPGSIVLLGCLLAFFQTRKRDAISVTRAPAEAAASVPELAATNNETLLAQVRADMEK